LDISFIYWLRFISVLFSVFWNFHSGKIDVIGDKGSGDTTTVDVQTLWEDFLNTSPKSAYFIDAALSGKKQKTSVLETALPKCWIIRISSLLDSGLKEFFCTEAANVDMSPACSCRMVFMCLAVLIL
jgi:hypothetical protein